MPAIKSKLLATGKKVNSLGPRRDRRKQNYHRAPKLSDSEAITIMILFHFSGYKCLKHFYTGYVLSHMRHMFPNPVSYNRFTELEKKVVAPLILFLKKCLMGGCTRISFVDSTALRVCRNQRIHLHRVFSGLTQRGIARWDASTASSSTWYATRKANCSVSCCPRQRLRQGTPQEHGLSGDHFREARRGQGIHQQGALRETVR